MLVGTPRCPCTISCTTSTLETFFYENIRCSIENHIFFLVQSCNRISIKFSSNVVAFSWLNLHFRQSRNNSHLIVWCYVVRHCTTKFPRFFCFAVCHLKLVVHDESLWLWWLRENFNPMRFQANYSSLRSFVTKRCWKFLLTGRFLCRKLFHTRPFVKFITPGISCWFCWMRSLAHRFHSDSMIRVVKARNYAVIV